MRVNKYEIKCIRCLGAGIVTVGRAGGRGQQCFKCSGRGYSSVVEGTSPMFRDFANKFPDVGAFLETSENKFILSLFNYASNHGRLSTRQMEAARKTMAGEKNHTRKE